MATQDTSKSGWICPECGRSFSGKFQLSYHQKIAHGIEPLENHSNVLEEVFGSIHERFRDKTRDKLWVELCELGIDAELAERGLINEKKQPQHELFCNAISCSI